MEDDKGDDEELLDPELELVEEAYHPSTILGLGDGEGAEDDKDDDYYDNYVADGYQEEV